MHRTGVSPTSFFLVALLSAAAGLAQTSGFLLGVDYSEWTAQGTRQIATDAAGDLYLLGDVYDVASGLQLSWVVKLSPDGQTVLWGKTLASWAAAMAVDPAGGVYFVPAVQFVPNQQAIQPDQVVKLDGTTGSVLWTASVGFTGSALAVDSAGRVWVASSDGSTGYIARLNAQGTAAELTIQTQQFISPTLLTLDGAGSAFLVSTSGGSPTGSPFVSSIGKIASNGVLSSYAQVDGTVTALFVDANDNATVFETQSINDPASPYSKQDELLRFNAAGAAVSTIRFTESSAVSRDLALLTVDTAGSAYIGGYNTGYVHGVKHSLATCGSNWLKVIAPDGSILQDTYIPGAYNDMGAGDSKLMVAGPGGTFFLVAISDPHNTAAIGPGPYEAYPGGQFLLHFSQNPNAQTYPLACQANAASYQITAVSPGEILSLFGSGLGPEQGVQGSATSVSPYPKELAGVQVTFDGNPAPLLWVQDSQINVIAPWSLTPGQKTEICVNNNGAKTNCQTWPVWTNSPGVFTADGFHAVALNQDGALNSAQNPAKTGSTVTIFATGLGPLTLAPPDGSLIGSSVPVSVEAIVVDEVVNNGELPPGVYPATVSYAGPVQGMVAGVSEVSFAAIAGTLSLCAGGSSCTTFRVYVVN